MEAPWSLKCELLLLEVHPREASCPLATVHASSARPSLFKPGNRASSLPFQPEDPFHFLKSMFSAAKMDHVPKTGFLSAFSLEATLLIATQCALRNTEFLGLVMVCQVMPPYLALCSYPTHLSGFNYLNSKRSCGRRTFF